MTVPFATRSAHYHPTKRPRPKTKPKTPPFSLKPAGTTTAQGGRHIPTAVETELAPRLIVQNMHGKCSPKISAFRPVAINLVTYSLRLRRLCSVLLLIRNFTPMPFKLDLSLAYRLDLYSWLF